MKSFKQFLTERENQITTPEFKRWFGKSKVVDRMGKPLVVYHDSPANFDSFRPVSFFTDDKRGARTFARGGSVNAFYLSIQNPATDDDIYRIAAEVTGRTVDDIMEAGLAFVYLDGGEVKDDPEPIIVDELIRRGFDGAYIEEDSDYQGNAIRSWAAFHPNQIKSATDNSGSFGSSDNVYAMDAERR
jgi:hypothetical protein